MRTGISLGTTLLHKGFVHSNSFNHIGISVAKAPRGKTARLCWKVPENMRWKEILAHVRIEQEWGRREVQDVEPELSAAAESVAQ